MWLVTVIMGHKLLLTSRKLQRLCKTFTINSSATIKSSKLSCLEYGNQDNFLLVLVDTIS